MDESSHPSQQKIKSYLPWLIWGTTGTFFFYQFIVRVSPGVIEDTFRESLGLTRCEFGAIAAYYYVGYTLMQIPTGIMLDQIGVRRLLTIACLLCAMGCYFFAKASDTTVLSIGRLLMGIGSAFAFLSCVKTATLWFKPERLSSVIGIAVFLGPIGGVFGGRPLAYLVETYGWKFAIIILGLAGAILACAAWFVVKDRKNNIYTGVSEEDPSIGVIDSLKIILKNPKTYLFGLYGSLMYTFLSGFADLWGTPFMIEAYRVDKMEASSSVSCIYLGIAFGGPLTAWFSQIYRSYKIPKIIGVFLCFLMLSLIIYYPDLIPFNLTIILFFLLGVCISTQFLAFSSVCQINPTQISATACAFHNMMCMASGIIIQRLLGYLIDERTPAHIEASVQDYQYALTIIPICFMIGAAVTFFMKETFPKENE